MDDKLITIARFSTPTTAHVARARLEADGIDAVVLNENIATLAPFLGFQDGGQMVQLQVRAEDARLAADSLGLEAPSNETEEPEVPAACPRCNCERVAADRNPLTGFFNALAKFYDPDLACYRWRCPKCHHGWKTR